MSLPELRPTGRSATIFAVRHARFLIGAGLAAWLIASYAARPIGQTGGATVIAAGDHRDRDLRPGVTHRYAVDLHAGEFLHAVVAPHGIDVEARLIGPEGNELLAVDLSYDQLVAETIMTIGERDGRYEIHVRPVVENAPAGRYTIRVEAIRGATASDRVRVQAMRDLETGVRLRSTRQPKDMNDARAPLEAARRGFHEAADRENEARAGYEAANNLMNLVTPEGFDLAQQVLAAYRERDDEVGIARTLQVIGSMQMTSGKLADAQATLTESLAFSRKTDDVVQQMLSSNTLGIVYGRMGRTQKAIEAFEYALPLSRIVRQPRLAFSLLNNLGIANKDLGDYRRSIEYYDRALDAVGDQDPSFEATVLNNVGNLHEILGDYDKALAAHERALLLARQAGSVENEARGLNTIGSTYYKLGEFQKALEYHEQALAIRRRVNDRIGESASLDGAALARHRLGRSDRAVADLRSALGLRRDTGERLRESDTLLHLAQVERDRGHTAAALEHIEDAVQLTELLRGQLLGPDLRESFFAREQERYEVYVDVLMQLDRERPGEGFDRRGFEASEAGRARVLLESLIDARADIRSGIDAALLERERDNHRRLNAASARLSTLLTRQATPEAIGAARTEFETIASEGRALQARIRQESPAYAALTQPRPLSADETRDILDDDTIVFEYALGDARSWMWAVTNDGVSAFELSPRQEIERAARSVYDLAMARQPRTGESAAARSARVIKADAEWRERSTDLARMILGPAAARFSDRWRGKRLVIVATEMLQYVPFSALPDPLNQLPLVVDHELVKLPSVSVLAAIRQQADARSAPKKTLAVFADPVFDAGDPRVEAAAGVRKAGGPSLSRLPFSKREAIEIASFVPPGERLEATDFRANRATAIGGDLANYRFVHFATHGVFDAEEPRLSGLVFSLVDRNGKPQDGYLRLGDVYNMRLPADVVVLSGCQTALGKEIRGEGLVGLTRGFMYAGARRVVASLWEVDDLATAELMRRFYRGMIIDGLAPAAALRAAQRELSRQPRWASPFFWSAFELQGDWR